MQETFEHNISQQLDNFTLQPSSMVWQEVDAALHPKRKKRIIIWWWLGAAIFAFGIFGFWALYSSTNMFKTISDNSITSKSVLLNAQTQVIYKTKKIVNNILTIDSQYVIKLNKQEKALLFKPTISLTNGNENTDSKSDKIALIKPTNNTIKITENIDNDLVIINNKKLKALDFVKEIDSTNNAIIIANKHNSATTTSTNILQKKRAFNYSRWLVTVGGGMLQTSLNYKTNGLAFSNGAPSLSSTGNSTNNLPAILNAKTGFNLQFGVTYNTELDKHWALQTGLQYQYLTNKQGLKADTTTGFTNSFIADNNNFIANNAHWLQIPITVTYNLQPKNKHKLCLLLGGSVAYTLSEKWLISNINTGRFYYNASLNNRWLIGVHTGLSYALSEQLQLAILGVYTLTPIQSNVTDKHHFVQYNLQISTPLNISRTKKSKK